MNEELSPPARPAPALMSTCSCPPSLLTFLELLQAESSWPGVLYSVQFIIAEIILFILLVHVDVATSPCHALHFKLCAN